MLKLYINPQIGSFEIDCLARGDVIKTLRSIRAKGKSKNTVEAGRNVISGVCEYAIDEEHIKDNPCVGVIRRLGFQRKKDRKPITVFTPDEVESILQKSLEYGPQWHPLFLVCFRAGLRLGEALALEWSDLNWREGYILVQRSFRNGRTTPTKNGRLRRVDMTDQLIPVLRKLNLKRTVDIYGHILPTENRNILNSLDTPNRTLYAPSKNEKAATR
ncbi:integrase family protein [Desulfosarcina variabilis str. Montpellier]|uniref:tyrosine-type recombinase/integrase n=1 Tax=Desulfosarcina variabilis TaxID=2300 RepID=UPI003AFA4143